MSLTFRTERRAPQAPARNVDKRTAGAADKLDQYTKMSKCACAKYTETVPGRYGLSNCANDTSSTQSGLHDFIAQKVGFAKKATLEVVDLLSFK